MISHSFRKIHSECKGDLRAFGLESLAALTVEAAAMVGVPVEGTSWMLGKGY